MTVPFFRLLGQIFLATETWESTPDAKEALSKAGLNKDRIQAGKDLLARGQELAHRRIYDGVEDRIAGHATHTAAAELQMWQQTVRSALRHRGVSADVIETAVDGHLHAEDHTVTAIGSALRTLGVLRTNDEILEAFSRPRSLHDLVVRGNTLSAKVLDCSTIQLAPRGDDDNPVYGKLEAHGAEMFGWVQELGRAAEQASDKPAVLGLVGYLPDGVGRPGGGTSFAVPLHQRAQADAPEPGSTNGCAGWSVGRQGRNRENLGKGFVEPTFE